MHVILEKQLRSDWPAAAKMADVPHSGEAVSVSVDQYSPRRDLKKVAQSNLTFLTRLLHLNICSKGGSLTFSQTLLSYSASLRRCLQFNHSEAVNHVYVSRNINLEAVTSSSSLSVLLSKIKA